MAPYGAGSSIMFAPKMSVAALREYVSLTCHEGKPLAWRDPELGGYGLVDSFHLDPPHADEEYLGIDLRPHALGH